MIVPLIFTFAITDFFNSHIITLAEMGPSFLSDGLKLALGFTKINSIPFVALCLLLIAINFYAFV